MSTTLSAAKIAARISARKASDGPRSIFGRILQDSIDPVSRRFAGELSENASDDELTSAMAAFAARYPQHFPPQVDVSEFTPMQLLEYANCGVLPVTSSKRKVK